MTELVSYAHALSPVESVLSHFLWDPGPMNATISRKLILLLKFARNSYLGSKKLVSRSINDNFALQN